MSNRDHPRNQHLGGAKAPTATRISRKFRITE